MPLIGGDNAKLRFILTDKGQKTLIEKGLLSEIKYYSLYDPGINYQVDAFPSLITNVCGSNKNITSERITPNDNLIL